MNIFVLCTGRCGSTTFVRACQHITNYTCGHETRSGLLGPARLDYPVNHIEADNRLAWLLDRLDKSFGDNALYIHLYRDRHATAHSFAQRYGTGIMRAYRGDGVVTTGWSEAETGQASWQHRIDVALDYCETVSANIELFLRDKTEKMSVELESFETGFAEFWQRVGAQGNYEAAVKELREMHNAGKGSTNPRQRALVSRGVKKAGRVLAKFPTFVRNA